MLAPLDRLACEFALPFDVCSFFDHQAASMDIADELCILSNIDSFLEIDILVGPREATN